jgi:hypothetical protein
LGRVHFVADLCQRTHLRECRSGRVGIAQKLLTVCGNPLFRSLLGVERTWRLALHMSANDQSGHRGPFQCAGFSRYDTSS